MKTAWGKMALSIADCCGPSKNLCHGYAFLQAIFHIVLYLGAQYRWLDHRDPYSHHLFLQFL
jgi:hypothetical protein